MRTFLKSIGLILLLALCLPACSHFSKSARQQRAYEKYVHKSMRARSKQKAKIAKHQAEIPYNESGPVRTEMTTMDQGPQAVPSEATTNW